MNLRSWHTWTRFAVAVALVLTVMAWLSVRALDYEHAEAVADARASLEETVRLALWRIDSAMSVTLAQFRSVPVAQLNESPARTDLGSRIVEQVGSQYGNRPLITNSSNVDNVASNNLRQTAQGQSALNKAELEQRAALNWSAANGNSATLSNSSITANSTRIVDLAGTTGGETIDASGAGALTLTGGVIASGAGTTTLTLTGTNTYTGSTTIANGILNVSDTSGLGTVGMPILDGNGRRSVSLDISNNGEMSVIGPVFRIPIWFEERTGLKIKIGTGTISWSDNEINAPPSLSLSAPAANALAPAIRVAFSPDNQKIIFESLEPGNRPASIPVDWPALRRVLLDRIADLLPDADIVPLSSSSNHNTDSRRLASIPARLVVPASAMPIIVLPWNTPLRISLLIAWFFALLGTAAVGVLLRGAISLGERRGAFVSAVTHELRTPLTTFRMYADLLAQNMVPDPRARNEYLQTLVTEADRLGHLVENVLTFARLERRIGPFHAESLTVAQLLDRVSPALVRRTQQAGHAINIDIPPAVAAVSLQADPIAVGQILLNLVDNACKYGRPPIELAAQVAGGRLLLRIVDHGSGIAAHRDKIRQLFGAFNKPSRSTTPGIGIGLHLSRRIARDLGGDLELEPAANSSTVFRLSLPLRP